MKSLGLSRYALTIGAASVLLAGCGGAQLRIAMQSFSEVTTLAAAV